MMIDEVKKDGDLYLNIHGKVDSSIGEEFTNTLIRAFQKSLSVVVNFEEVTYISSMGLRGLLLGEKIAQSKNGRLVVINVSDDVLDTFRVTGFDKLLTIR
ncbi:MAG: STAS domain-containing protein [Lachnospiraceae bacterium]|nr:STAS domain-containing protein [Lachnospiraceae bacterium]